MDISVDEEDMAFGGLYYRELVLGTPYSDA